MPLRLAQMVPRNSRSEPEKIHGAFLPVMDMIALPEWSPNLITERPGWGACGAEISHEIQVLPPMALTAELDAASIKTERYWQLATSLRMTRSTQWKDAL
jgi:hypothetical protein